MGKRIIDIIDELIIGSALLLLAGLSIYKSSQCMGLKEQINPQTHNVIGDPNKPETFIEMTDPNGNIQRFYRTIDGKSIEEYLYNKYGARK